MLESSERVGAWKTAIRAGRSDELCDRLVENHHREFGVPPRLIRALSRAWLPSLHEGGVLTDRELDVLSCAARGMTASQSAECLHIGVASVKTYRKGAIHKLQARNMSHAAVLATAMGLIQGPPSEGYERVAA